MREGRNESQGREDAARGGQLARRRRSATLGEEARRLAADPADTAERRAVMADMDPVSADWPA